MASEEKNISVKRVFLQTVQKPEGSFIYQHVLGSELGTRTLSMIHTIEGNYEVKEELDR